MNFLDVPKLMMKARRMQGEMGKKKAAGKSGTVAVAINGLYKITEKILDKDELVRRFPGVDEKTLVKVANTIMDDMAKAYEHAQTELQKVMAEGSSLDDIKSMLN